MGFFTDLRRLFREVHPGLRRKNLAFLSIWSFQISLMRRQAPVAKNAQAFLQWGCDNNYPAIGFYSAYPGLWVLDIRALLADRKAKSGTADSSCVPWS